MTEDDMMVLLTEITRALEGVYCVLVVVGGTPGDAHVTVVGGAEGKKDNEMTTEEILEVLGIGFKAMSNEAEQEGKVVM